MASQLSSDRRLAAQASQVSAELGLGPCAEAASGRPATGWQGCGCGLLIILGLGLLFVPLTVTGTARAASAGLDAAIFAFGIALTLAGGTSRTDQLFAFQDGLVLAQAGRGEPQVLRWPQLEAITIQLGSSYSKYYLSSVELSAGNGQQVRLARHLRPAFPVVIALAERALAPSLVPAAIAALERGHEVTIGKVTASRYGLSWGKGPALRWSEIREVTFDPEVAAQHAVVSLYPPDSRLMHLEGGGGDIMRRILMARAGRALQVEGTPNAFVLRYLIAHVGGSAGFPVIGHSASWAPQPSRGPGATLIAPPPGSPGASPAVLPPPRGGRARRGHPVRIALLVAAIAGAATGLNVARYHGPQIMTPCKVNCGSDRVGSLPAPGQAQPGNQKFL